MPLPELLQPRHISTYLIGTETLVMIFTETAQSGQFRHLLNAYRVKLGEPLPTTPPPPILAVALDSTTHTLRRFAEGADAVVEAAPDSASPQTFTQASLNIVKTHFALEHPPVLLWQAEDETV